ncbi:hypothetical protein ACHAXT_011690 [Thalassiosira profunda]
MARPAIPSRGALLLLLLTAQMADVCLAISSRAASLSIASLTLALSPLRVIIAEEVGAAPAAADAPDIAARECTEPGTCSSEGGAESQSTSETDGANNDAPNADDAPPATFEQRFGPYGDRLISAAELALHIGKGGATEANPIWLSILGKVYDVTTGEDFYGADKGSYNFYAGRDASPCFSSGENTLKGASEKLEEWEDKKLMAVWEWSEFYQNHETYKYLGLLAGSRYYDEDGNELELRKDIITRSSEAKKVADEERERKKKERLAARQARKKDKQK